VTEAREDLTLWLVMQSRESEGWNGREWVFEDADDSAMRGYFFTEEDAEKWIHTEKQKHIAEGRAKNDADVERLNAEALERHTILSESDAIKRTEYDALVKAGVTPSFDRPSERKPFRPRVGRFSEDVYLRGLGLRWETVEMQPCRWRKDDEKT